MSDWIIYALLSAVAAALATVFAKIGLQNVDSLTATALRSIVMTLLAFIVLYSYRGFSDLFKLTRLEYLFIVMSGLAGGASWIFYFIALQRGEASKVALIDRTSVLFVLLLSILILGEELTLKKLVATLLVFTALIILLT
ncbi:MAG: EamA family transporter [Desulfurococcaceae archaeon]|jgi:transporter family protein